MPRLTFAVAHAQTQAHDLCRAICYSDVLFSYAMSVFNPKRGNKLEECLADPYQIPHQRYPFDPANPRRRHLQWLLESQEDELIHFFKNPHLIGVSQGWTADRKDPCWADGSCLSSASKFFSYAARHAGDVVSRDENGLVSLVQLVDIRNHQSSFRIGWVTPEMIAAAVWLNPKQRFELYFLKDYYFGGHTVTGWFLKQKLGILNVGRHWNRVLSVSVSARLTTTSPNT